MNEFEWLRQTRALDRPQAPQRDLWDGIAARLAAPPAAPRQRVLPWAMAAALAALSLLAGGLATRQVLAPTAHVPRQASAATPWKPHDPRLSGAAVELEVARVQLTQALRQAPRSDYLRYLLERNHHQQRRLQRLEQQAG